MHFEDISSFFEMGGYGLYVWLSFGVSAMCLLIMWLDAYYLKRTLLTRVLKEQARQRRINAAAEQGNNGERI